MICKYLFQEHHTFFCFLICRLYGFVSVILYASCLQDSQCYCVLSIVYDFLAFVQFASKLFHSFMTFCIPSEGINNGYGMTLKQLEKKFVRCSMRVLVSHVKAMLHMKLSVNPLSSVSVA